MSTKDILNEIENEIFYQFKMQDSKPSYEVKPQYIKDKILLTLRLNSYDSNHLKLGPIKKALSKFGPVKQSTFKHPRLTSGNKEVTFEIGVAEDMNENLTQYYGVDKYGKAKFVAMSEEQVKKWAENHPEDGIVEIEDSSGRILSLSEALNLFDKREFEENSRSFELEMLYESVKTTLSAQQKNELAKFVRRAKTAEEISTYMTGMLAQENISESYKHTILHENYGQRLEEVKELAYKLEDDLNDLNVWIDDLWYDGQDGTITVFVSNGDWKHDHLRLDYFLNDWIDKNNLTAEVRTRDIESDSDVYDAYHTIKLRGLSEDLTEARSKVSVPYKDKIINTFIDRCLEKFNAFGDETDIELELPEDLDTDEFWYELEDSCDECGILFDVREKEEIPDSNMIYVYLFIYKKDISESYIPQKSNANDKFSNGRLRDFDPYPFMRKIMNSGQSMNSIRTFGNDYYTIFVSYENHFGPKGADDLDTKYTLDIIKETPDGNQTRDLFERDLLWNEVAEKLIDWRQDKVTENPLAESITKLSEGYSYRKVEKAILQAISNIGGERFETIDNNSCSYRFEGKVSRKALIADLSDALKSTGYTILSDNSGVEVQDNDNWWQGTNIEIYKDTDNQEKGCSFFIIGIYDLF